MSKKKEAVNDFQAEFIDVIGRVRRLRKYLRDVDSVTLIKFREKLDIIISEHEDEELAELEKFENKKRNVARIKELMNECGISEDDIIQADFEKEQLHKPTRVPKYLFIDSDGNKHRWTGRGKTPLIFKELISQGVNIDEECLARNIEKPSTE